MCVMSKEQAAVNQASGANEALDDAQAIALVRTGKTDAFATIGDTYSTRIVRYLYRLTGDRDEAEDLAQDTFLQAYQSILKTTSELSLSAWLYRIATNNANRRWRRRKLISFIPLPGAEKADPYSFESSPNRVIERIVIEDALLEVPRGHRACMVLHYVEGLKYREIATIVGISEDAVQKRIAHGNEKFREVFNRESESASDQTGGSR